MRVIAGEFRSRKLKAPSGIETRPTPDRLREALFNILAPMLDGLVFVDAYAGSGSVGIEALSRGARRAIFIDSGKAAVEIIRENLDSLGIAGRAEVRCARVVPLLKTLRADVIFLDPPYPLQREYTDAMSALGAVPPDGLLVIVQHASREPLADQFGLLRRSRTIRQGDNSLSFYTSRQDG